MRKDTTKKFLMRENRYTNRMTSKAISEFRKRKIKILGTHELITFKKMIGIEKEIDFRLDRLKNAFFMSGLKKKVEVSNQDKIMGFNMILCSSYEFDMEGYEKKGCNPPKKTIIEQSFWMGETEVTQELYEFVMGYNPSYFCDVNSRGKKDGYRNKIGDTSKHPVERVSWYDAILFCNKLSELSGLNKCYKMRNVVMFLTGNKRNITRVDVVCNFTKNGYRLPMEMEWEYAAKAGTNAKWIGKNNDLDIEYAWFEDNSNKQTHPVATKKPNEWGFYDMIGNVCEWVWVGESNSTNNITQMIRGGAYAYRKIEEKDLLTTIGRYGQIVGMESNQNGFRIVRNM